MTTPKLTPEQLIEAAALLNDIRQRIKDLSGHDPEIEFAYRRRIYKQLEYDERSKTQKRKALQKKKWKRQDMLCGICNKPLPLEDSELDRLKAIDGYTEENVLLVHQDCHRKDQKERNFR